MAPTGSKSSNARSNTLKRSSALLDPEQALRAQQSTTDVELLNLSTDGRARRIRPRVHAVPIAPRPLHLPLFDFPYDEGDPNFPTHVEPPPPDAFDFDPAEVMLLPTPEMSNVVVKESQRMKRWLNSVSN